MRRPSAFSPGRGLQSVALILAACLSGAAGLALETILIGSAGIALGYGRSGAIGLAAFLALWSVGAFAAGRSRGSTARNLLAAGSLVALLAWPAVRITLGGGAPSAVLAIAAIGFVQGAFLPLLTRAYGASSSGPEVALLFAANLSGCVAGAYAIGDSAVGAFGRPAGALLAGAIGFSAGLLGALAARGAAAPAPRAARPETRVFAPAAATIALCTGWLAGLEWISLRLGVLWLGGMQPALRSVLAASLIALAAGAAVVPVVLPRDRRAIPFALALCALGAAWPLVAARALSVDTLRSTGEIVHALVLVGPALTPFGALVPVLHRALRADGDDGGLRLGRLLLHEALGALTIVPLVHFFFVPRFGLSGATGILEACGALAFLAWIGSARVASLLGAGLCVALGLAIVRRPSPALATPPLRNPALAILSFTEDRDFAVAVVDDGIQGERTLLTDGFRAAGTGEEYRYMRVLGHLPVLLSPHPRRVAVLALGTGTTVGAVSLHTEVEHIDVLEISRAVVEAAPWFETKNHGALSGRDPRVAVRLGDGRKTLAGEVGAYDVVTMEPLLPDSPFGVYLYTREFYATVRAALTPGGLACQWVPPHALPPGTFDAVLDAFASAFPWSSVWLFGTQTILLGGESVPTLSPARFPPATGDLHDALADLGLASPAGLLARYLGDGAGLRGAPRALSDEDPWVIYAARESGVSLLRYLPENLARLIAKESDPAPAWLAAAGTGAHERLDAIRWLHRARERQAQNELELRAGADPGRGAGARGERDALLDRAERACPDDPEIRDLRLEIRFQDELNRGVAILASDRTDAGASDALDHLSVAAGMRIGRGDVHLYLAVALERLGKPAAQKALEAALVRCPRIAETSAGARARELGLSDAAWARLESAAREHDLFGLR